MFHLKSKNKSWKGTSFGMCNENYAIAFFEQCFTNMTFDTHDANQIELGKHKGKVRTRHFEYGE